MAEAPHTAVGEDHGKSVEVDVLAPNVNLADAKDDESTKFGLRGVPIVVKPGVKVVANHVACILPRPSSIRPTSRSSPAPRRRGRWQSMSTAAFWTLCTSIIIAIVVSLFTKPKPDSELKNVVMGLTPRPDEGPCPWYKRPMLWAAVVFAAVVLVDIIFW